MPYSEQMFSSGQVLTAAQMNSIDDFLASIENFKYETWTPTILGGGAGAPAAYSDQIGHAYRINNLCIVFGRVRIDGIGTLNSSEFYIQGMPYDVEAGSGRGGGMVVNAQGLNIAAGESITLTAAGDALTPQLWGETYGTATMTTAELSGDGDLTFVAVYHTDDPI